MPASLPDQIYCPIMPAAKKKQSPKAGKKTSPGVKNFTAIFTALRRLLAPYEDRLALKTPNAGYCYLESRTPTYKNRPMFFAGVRAGKNYVSYYLMSVYARPEMLKAMSPRLKKRMQGKACFNFTAVDQELFGELSRLTEAGFQAFKSLKYL
jgi:hypothetical protein